MHELSEAEIKALHQAYADAARRALDAGFDGRELGGHSLKRGAMTTGMDRGIHPTRLKQLGRHKSYAVLDEYLQLGDPFEGHPLTGVL